MLDINALDALFQRQGQLVTRGGRGRGLRICGCAGALASVRRYAYDAHRCMTTSGSQAIRYDPERRPLRVGSGGSTVAYFAYDGHGTRRLRRV